jgi:hypothetical protein
MKKRNYKGEFAGLLSSPFLAKSTSQEAFNNKYTIPKAKPTPPIEEVSFRIFLVLSVLNNLLNIVGVNLECASCHSD